MPTLAIPSNEGRTALNQTIEPHLDSTQEIHNETPFKSAAPTSELALLQRRFLDQNNGSRNQRGEQAKTCTAIQRAQRLQTGVSRRQMGRGVAASKLSGRFRERYLTEMESQHKAVELENHSRHPHSPRSPTLRDTHPPLRLGNGQTGPSHHAPQPQCQGLQATSGQACEPS